MGLVRVWQSWGIDADAVMGVGVGQYSAACAAGVMSVEDGIGLVAARERLMAAVGVPVKSDAVPAAGNVGDPAEIGEFESFADTLDFFPADRPFICTQTGQVVPIHRLLGGAYWRQQCVTPPKLRESCCALAELDCNAVLELGVGSTLSEIVRAAWPGPAPDFLPGMPADQDEWGTLLSSLGRLFARGVAPEFHTLHKSGSRQKVSLPTYPFERTRYWITEVARHAGT
jgi:acyl transferase domain-containing protein